MYPLIIRVIMKWQDGLILEILIGSQSGPNLAVIDCSRITFGKLRFQTWGKEKLRTWKKSFFLNVRGSILVTEGISLENDNKLFTCFFR